MFTITSTRSKKEIELREDSLLSELIKEKDALVGTIYQWGDYDYGWMGRIIIVKVTDSHIHVKNIYRLKDVVESLNLNKISKDWFVKADERGSRYTLKQFARKLAKNGPEKYIYYGVIDNMKSETEKSKS